MTTSLVTPGTDIGIVGELEAGDGTTTIDDRIVATTTGYTRVETDASRSKHRNRL